jgi:hypothetical protein
MREMMKNADTPPELPICPSVMGADQCTVSFSLF